MIEPKICRQLLKFAISAALTGIVGRSSSRAALTNLYEICPSDPSKGGVLYKNYLFRGRDFLLNQPLKVIRYILK